MIMDSQITKKKKQSSLPTSIEDLADELLSEILVRLHCHESVITSKFVSKHWLFVLSNPKFVVDFLNHKKIQAKTTEQLPWSFLSTMKMKMKMTGNDDDNNELIPNHKVFNSPNFTLNFLPFPFKVAATFKDLILCTNTNTTGGIINNNMNNANNNNNDDNGHYYYVICNPVTKQWVALPPTPTLSAPPDHHGSSSWASLICEEPYYNVNVGRCDYRFRIVVIHPTPIGWHYVNHPSKVFNLMVFCSEIFQWKRINVSVPIWPGTANHSPAVLRAPFFGVLCNGMVCLRHHCYFGMFNPFDVTPHTLNDTTLQARVLRTKYPKRTVVLECAGTKLVAIDNTGFATKPGMGPLALFSVRSSELDLKNINAVHQVWHSNFRGRCTDYGGSMPLSTVQRGIIGIHPSNKQLLYVLTADNEVVLCDMGSKSLKVLGTLDPDHLESNARLQLQYWPTPLPLPLPLPALNHQ